MVNEINILIFKMFTARLAHCFTQKHTVLLKNILLYYMLINKSAHRLACSFPSFEFLSDLLGVAFGSMVMADHGPWRSNWLDIACS